MSHTDPIADMLTRIRNGLMAEKTEVSIPLSKIKVEIAKILKAEGYVQDYKVEESAFPPYMIVKLKYMNKKSAIEGLDRVSKPGRRVYAGTKEIPKVLGGLGVAVLSTSKGLMTGKQCENNSIGGEVLLYVW